MVVVPCELFLRLICGLMKLWENIRHLLLLITIMKQFLSLISGIRGRNTLEKKHQYFTLLKKIKNGIALSLGTNEMVTFHFSGYATTIIGPELKGVGDKNGGSDERSEDYENLLK